MLVTKYEHACLTVEINNQLLIVDPGNFTKSLVIPKNVVVIVITHEHMDHFDPDMLAAIYNKNPDSLLFSLDSIVSKMPDHKSKIVKEGDVVDIGPFHLEFFGYKHAEIHSSIPLINNIGVMVNNSLYYPGDSFTTPDRPVPLLALPASGPWFKTSTAIDFMLSVKPTKIFPTHNIHNSVQGQELFDRIVGGFAERSGVEYVQLAINQSIEI